MAVAIGCNYSGSVECITDVHRIRFKVKLKEVICVVWLNTMLADDDLVIGEADKGSGKCSKRCRGM